MCNSRHVRNIPQVTKIIPAPFNARAFNDNRARKRQNREPSRDRERGSEPRTPNLFPRHDQRHPKNALLGKAALIACRRSSCDCVRLRGRSTHKAALGVMYRPAGVHNLKVELFDRCFETFLCRMSLSNYVARNCGCRLVGALGSARASLNKDRSEKCRELFAVSYWLRSP